MMEEFPQSPPHHRPTDWQGSFTPYSVGDPGRAGSVEARPARLHEYRPDTVFDGVEIVGPSGLVAKVRAASTRGRSHRYGALPRQDSFAFATNDRYLVGAVADGVSSAPLSHHAADLAVQDGCNIALQRLEAIEPSRIDWAEFLEELSDRIVELADPFLPDRKLAEKDKNERRSIVAVNMATTLVVVILDLLRKNGKHKVTFCSYGDSSAWILRKKNDWEIQTRPRIPVGGIWSSKTLALPLATPNQHALSLTTDVDTRDVIAIMTDGIGDPLGAGTGTVGGFLSRKWSSPPHPIDFAAQVDFARRSHDDDRTVLAIWPMELEEG